MGGSSQNSESSDTQEPDLELRLSLWSAATGKSEKILVIVMLLFTIMNWKSTWTSQCVCFKVSYSCFMEDIDIDYSLHKSNANLNFSFNVNHQRNSREVLFLIAIALILFDFCFS